MSDTILCLKPINDLLKERFYIPAFQRGYRWTPRQVTELLDDISAFQRESNTGKKEMFYCLQPIVVLKRPGGEWELIDGQQRLTTIHLILTYLRPLLDVLDKTRFRLDYETRPNSAVFLDNIDPSMAESNIDFYHMHQAYETIGKWFSDKDGNHKLGLLQCLLNSDDAGKNVKVIWYELSARENPVDVFIRLNMGKIPLTNAELIRALFLRSRPGDSGTTLRQLQIAQEWDDIEKTLQSDSFWCFISPKWSAPDSPRIEYIFGLITQETPVPGLASEDPYYTFNAYSRLFADNHSDLRDKWLRVKQYFMTCEEWYQDRTLYHLIGYLIANGFPVLDLMREAKGCAGKTAFQLDLKRKIFEQLFRRIPNDFPTLDELRSGIGEMLSGLDYEDHKSRIRSALLLFNIATLLQNKASNLRFPFDSYKKENWDIEHIRSVSSDRPTRIDDQKKWLENVLEYWQGLEDGETPSANGAAPTDICARINNALQAATFDSDAFDPLYDRILEEFNENDPSETDNGLANLTLLDAHTNRSYKNAVFPIKRRRILMLDKIGTFTPLCTTNVFLKYYSRRIDQMMFWSEPDRKDYLAAIIDTLAAFFAPMIGAKV